MLCGCVWQDFKAKLLSDLGIQNFLASQHWAMSNKWIKKAKQTNAAKPDKQWKRLPSTEESKETEESKAAKDYKLPKYAHLNEERIRDTVNKLFNVSKAANLSKSDRDSIMVWIICRSFEHTVNQNYS